MISFTMMGQHLREEWRKKQKQTKQNNKAGVQILLQKESFFEVMSIYIPLIILWQLKSNSSWLLRLYKSAAVTVTLTLDSLWIALQQFWKKKKKWLELFSILPPQIWSDQLDPTTSGTIFLTVHRKQDFNSLDRRLGYWSHHQDWQWLLSKLVAGWERKMKDKFFAQLENVSEECWWENCYLPGLFYNETV